MGLLLVKGGYESALKGRLTMDELGFVKACDLFRYGRIGYVDAEGRRHIGIFVRCPKCDRIGKLKPQRKGYIIEHKDGRCRFGYCSEHWEYVDGLYRICKEMEPWIRADKPDLNGFLRWLVNKSGLSKSSILSVLGYVNVLLNRFGIVNLGELEWILKDLDVKEVTKRRYRWAYEWFWRWYKDGKDF